MDSAVVDAESDATEGLVTDQPLPIEIDDTDETQDEPEEILVGDGLAEAKALLAKRFAGLDKDQ